jgi:hypothetical protein
MTTILRFARSNAVAFLALFIALGGVGWAATSLPAGSVGTKQLRKAAVTSKKIAKGSITPSKFDQSIIGGSVRYWARISADGKVIASQPKAQIVAWDSSSTGLSKGGQIRWGKPIAPGCFALATAESFPTSAYASAETLSGNGGPGTEVAVALSGFVPVDVAVICP